jgi:hypothetical protein
MQEADPTFNAYRSMLTNFRARLKRNGVRSPPELLVMLGCSWSFFIEHLQEQFEGDMSWTSYGRVWSLHHCRPVNDFDFKRRQSDILVVNFWVNLRPLEITEHLARPRKRTIESDDIRQLELNIEKAKRLGRVGRLPWPRTCPVITAWQMWLSQWRRECSEPF